MIVSLIVAYDENYAIGFQNKLLWHLSDDLKNFKSLTMNKPIVMGRKTFESIGRALPGRRNIVISGSLKTNIPGVELVNSLAGALELLNSCDEIFIIGGGQIYQEAMEKDLVKRLYVTKVATQVAKADTYFVKWNESSWRKIQAVHHAKDDKNDFAWSFMHFEK